MKFSFRATLTIFILSLSIHIFGQDNRSLTINEWIKKIENQSELIFNYDPAILTNDPIKLPDHLKNPKEILENISNRSNYRFKFIDDKFVLISKPTNEKTYNYLIIKGQIKDENTGEALMFANVFTDDYQAGASTDEHGHFTIKGHINPEQNIVISYLGYEQKKVHLSELNPKTRTTITLSPSNHELTNIVITDTQNTFLSPSPSQSQVINTLRLPLLGGMPDKDPFYLAQMIPGVSAIGESVGNLSFRGSTQDQNLVTWNEIPLYHTSHFFGLMSSCNPLVVDEIQVFNDGFKSNYGGRIAGILSMNSKKTHTNRWSANAHLNLLSANVGVEGTLLKDKISLEATFRSSYDGFSQSPVYRSFFNQSFQQGRIREIDEFISNNNIEDFYPESRVSFLDYNLRALITPSNNDVIEINFLKASDVLANKLSFGWSDKVELDTISLKNNGWSSIWSHQFGKILKTKVSYVVSGFENSYQYTETNDPNGRNLFRIKTNTLYEQKWAFENSLTFQNIKIDAGYQGNFIRSQNYIKFMPSDVYNQDEDSDKTGKLHTVFLNYEYNNEKKFNINMGIRHSWYDLTNQTFTEPRLTMWQQLTDHWRIKVSAGKYTQVINQIEEPNAMQIEELFWRISEGEDGNVLIPITTNTQYSAGFQYLKKNWKVDFSMYTKTVENITALGLEFDTGLNPYWIATGSANGIEAALQKTWNNGLALLTYSYNDMTLDFGDDRIYPALYHHRHQCTYAHHVKINKFDFGLVYKFKTGRPYSEYQDFYLGPENEFGDKVPIFVYENRFDKFLPSYHRVDINATYQWKSVAKNKWSFKVGLSILNVLNTENIVQRVNYVDYSKWPEINPATFERKGLGFTPNLFMELGFK